MEQLGLAMILSFGSIKFPLISGIISFFDGSILQAEELSITVVPISANLGAQFREVFPPAENIAISGFSSRAISRSIRE